MLGTKYSFFDDDRRVSSVQQQGEFLRLCVIEALFSGGWRNRDTWKRFELRDETAVAGIKFRALKRLRKALAWRGATPLT